LTEPAQVRDVPEGCVVRVRVIPRARQTTIAGSRGGALLVRVAAPPVEGAANDALISHLAGVLGIPTRRLRVIAGPTSRHKQIQIDGLSAADLHARLGGR